MAQKYWLLDQEEQDEIQAAFLLEQERELFCHRLNAERYRAMIPRLSEGDWLNRVQELLVQTETRIDEVTSIIEATSLPSEERLRAAKTRLAGAP